MASTKIEELHAQISIRDAENLILSNRLATLEAYVFEQETYILEFSNATSPEDDQQLINQLLRRMEKRNAQEANAR